LHILLPIFHKDIKDAWFLPNKQSFTGLKEYLYLAIPSTLMLCLEFWGFEIMTLLSGYISVVATAAQTITLNVCFILFMFPLGLNIAATAIIGKYIGE
jgi:MATE family multidrug resistance protein